MIISHDAEQAQRKISDAHKQKIGQRRPRNTSISNGKKDKKQWGKTNSIKLPRTGKC